MTPSFKYRCIKVTLLEYLKVMLTMVFFPSDHEHNALFGPSLSFLRRGSAPNTLTQIRNELGIKEPVCANK